VDTVFGVFVADFQQLGSCHFTLVAPFAVFLLTMFYGIMPPLHNFRKKKGHDSPCGLIMTFSGEPAGSLALSWFFHVVGILSPFGRTCPREFTITPKHNHT